MNKRDLKLQELARRLVDREVIYCVSSLISGAAKLVYECSGFSDTFDTDEDEMQNLLVQDDWETPGDWFIREDADFDQLEKIVDQFGVWDDLMEIIGIRPEVYLPTHWVCDDCVQAIANDDYTGIDYLAVPGNEAEIAARHAEVRAGIENFDLSGSLLDETNEFSRGACDCCGTELAGRRTGYSDGTAPSYDIEDRINLADRYEEGTEKRLRVAVASMVDDWEWVGREFDLDPEQIEIFEHWIISAWLARKLAEKGEVIGEFAGLTIWGRSTTGQAISLDYVIQELAAELWPEDLVGLGED